MRCVVAHGAVAIHFAGSRIFLVYNLVKLTVHRPFRRVYKFVHCIYQIELFYLFQQELVTTDSLYPGTISISVMMAKHMVKTRVKEQPES